ncbi:SOS response-associated peptidase [Frigoribacterium sp. CG_9.8]|uniref:SOS response-associated peptidase n=1 Tax=Frigoribacterium sp. CG_9.8 TaxID=2787733 RepID=UPI001E3FE23D|nr:SOS response-associated peptidase [Frigoribacterium sp. CG_9.8]
MCGRFAMDKSTDDLIEEFVAVGGDFRNWRPGWNIRPTDRIAVVLESMVDAPEPVRRLELARWSLTPNWSKTLKMKISTFNARSEGITGKASFKSAIRSQRALIPVTGYYEWQTDAVTKKKTPFYLRAPAGESLAFAGIYSWWKDHSLDDDPGLWTLTTTILTADSVPRLAHIHDRNPVLLPPELWNDWLDPRIEGTQGFVDATVAAAHPVAESLEIIELLAVTDVEPVARD